MLSLRRYGAEVQFQADRETVSWVLERFRPYLDAAVVEGECPALSFGGWRIHAGEEAEPTGLGFSRHERRYASGEHCTFWVNVAGRMVIVQHRDPLWRRLYALRMIRNALRWELSRRGALFLHGVAVSMGAGGVCIVGPRLSGKSYLSYSLFRQGGWDFITQDDVCLLYDSAAATWRLLGWPGCLRLRLSGRDAFTELRTGSERYAHPANPLEANLPPEIGMFRIFPEELQRDLGVAIRAECIPRVLISLSGDCPPRLFGPLDEGEVRETLRRAWDVLPERRPGASPEDALAGRRPWRETVFDPFFLESFGLPSLAVLRSSLEAFASQIRGIAAGREALLLPELGNIVRALLTA
jgi:hypothetical protein